MTGIPLFRFLSQPSSTGEYAVSGGKVDHRSLRERLKKEALEHWYADRFNDSGPELGRFLFGVSAASIGLFVTLLSNRQFPTDEQTTLFHELPFLVIGFCLFMSARASIGLALARVDAWRDSDFEVYPSRIEERLAIPEAPDESEQESLEEWWGVATAHRQDLLMSWRRFWFIAVLMSFVVYIDPFFEVHGALRWVWHALVSAVTSLWHG